MQGTPGIPRSPDLRGTISPERRSGGVSLGTSRPHCPDLTWKVSRFLRARYSDTLFLALVPPVCLTFDYSMTFRLAGNHDTVLSFEASPVVRVVLENNLMVAYFLSLLALYFLFSLTMLHWLRGTRFYPFGVASLLIIGTAHFLGGLTWIARSHLFSVAVGTLVTTLFLVTALWMGRNLLADGSAGPGHS